MAKKHTRNQSTGLSTCLFAGKESRKTEKNSRQKEESISHCLPTSKEGSSVFHARVNQHPSNPFQFVKTRVEDLKDSFPGQVFQSTTATFAASKSSNEPVCQYHYYQTNSNRWVNQNEYKHQNINCWLENVLKNNQNNEREHEDLEKEHNTRDVSEIDDVTIADDSAATSLQRTKQRYKPYSACVKRDLPIVDQNETSYRQDKIRTLKALITKHDEHINELELYTNLELDDNKHNAAKKLWAAEKERNCQMHQNPNKPCSRTTGREKKTASLDFRNPNSIFFTVLEEEQFWHQQNSPQMPIARRRKGRSNEAGHCWSRCCATESLCGQHDEFRTHVELGNISAS